ncbi:hypothetical protein CTI14_48510, partial [Methylobacterium radiotolerans]
MGELRLGAGNTALNSMVPAILEHLVGRHPLISVEIQPGHSARFYPAIESGELDAAIARAGRTVHLTAKAIELIGPMREVLERIEKIRYLARSGEMMGELRLGAGNTALNSMVPAILEHLVGRHPL